MKIGMKVQGLATVRTMLRNVATRVPDTARGQMKRSAARIVKRAKLYVPEDEENLKNSIRIEKTYGYHGRLQIDIVVGDMSVVNAAGRLIDLNQYAAIIHERYSDMNPGERTLQKMAANPGVHIGEAFLTRAGEQEEGPLNRNIVSAISRVLAREAAK